MSILETVEFVRISISAQFISDVPALPETRSSSTAMDGGKICKNDILVKPKFAITNVHGGTSVYNRAISAASRFLMKFNRRVPCF